MRERRDSEREKIEKRKRINDMSHSSFAYSSCFSTDRRLLRFARWRRRYAIEATHRLHWDADVIAREREREININFEFFNQSVLVY